MLGPFEGFTAKKKKKGGKSGNIIRKSIKTKHSGNKTLYYDYLLSKTESKNKYILIYTGGVKTTENDNYLNTKAFLNFAKNNDVMLLTVYFKHNKKSFKHRKSYQYSKAWSGDAMKNIIKLIEDEHGINITKYFLMGHSGGAQFVLRYCIHFPKKIIAAWCSAPGNTDQATRSKDRAKIHLFLSCGTKDKRYPFIKTFIKIAKHVFPKLQFLPIPGAGHHFPLKAKKAALEIFSQLITKERESEKE